MITKILTIAVPTYNMQEYLCRCLDSLVVENDLMQQLEVLVVNDGSNDNSSAIAHKYHDKYPDTFFVIDKDNGHYGSCVNAALKISTGKYFRLLDADDWVNTEGLKDFIKALKKHDEDVIFTKFTHQYLYDKKSEICVVDGIEWEKIYDLNSEQIPMACLAMHGITFRLDFLHNINYTQTEGIAYTDTEFVYIPLCQAKTMNCVDIDLYQYFIGRTDQTVSKKSIVNNYSHFKKIYNRIFAYVPSNPNSNFENLRDVYLTRILRYLLNIQLLYSRGTKEHDIQLRNDLNQLKCSSLRAFEQVMNFKVYGIMYVKNWYHRNAISKLMNLLLRVYL